MKYQIISERTVNYDAVITQPSHLMPFLKKFSKKANEHFIVVTLDTAKRPIRIGLVSVGILDKTLIHPREIFSVAIKDNSSAIIVVHNHPSGNLEPSEEDKRVTKRLVDAGVLLGIPVLDHLIISKNGFYSFSENEEPSIR